MGQFGRAVSVLDARLIALANIADGSEKETAIRLLGELTPADSFSHFRAITALLRKSPHKEAVPLLEKMLRQPELTGRVETTFKQIIEENSSDPCDNIQRTFQLKELYLLKALSACDPGNALAAERMGRYTQSPQYLYASFCN
jgi:hypothetical protein